MNYLTQYYKNLSEQLQAKMNLLEAQREYYLKQLDYRRDKDTEPNPSDSVFNKTEPKPLPSNQPGKTIVGLSPEQIDALNDPNQGGQSGKFGDSSVDMSGNKDDWLGIQLPPRKLKPQPSFKPKKMIEDPDIFDVIPKKPKTQLINQERPLDVPPMSQDSIDFFRKKYNG